MPTKEQIISWAREQSAALQADMSHTGASDFGTGYWTADPKLKGVLHARATSALDLLRVYAGADSEWLARARAAFESRMDRESMESGVRAVGDILAAWADQVEAGVTVVRQVESGDARTVASSDLMGQVRVLIQDKAMHPAAAIVLAGAALETALRASVEQLGLDLQEKPGIMAYARSLRAAERLTKQDVKDVEQMAGLRNAAAHGEFEQLSSERAGLMEQQVNMFLAQLRLAMGDE